MRYLYYSLFLFLITFLIGGCQKVNESVSPYEDIHKDPVVLDWGDPNPISGSCVDLVAGQTEVVGEVCFEKIGNDLKITYTLSNPDCKISEVHVDLASELNNNGTTGFHANSQGNPTFGLFDRIVEFTEPTSDPVEVYFTYSQLKTALGVSDLTAGTKIYIAAHAGVCCPEQGPGVPILCPDLPNGSTASYATYPYNQVGSTWIHANFTYGSSSYGPYDGWCVDVHRLIQWSGQTVDFLCTTDGSYLCEEGGIFDKPENMDRVLWLINNRTSYSTATNNDVQWAIWKLLYDDIPSGSYQPTDMALVNTMVADALLNGVGYTPGCGDKTAVLIYDSGSDWCSYPTNGHQVLLIEVPVECVPQYGCETAMAFNYPPDGSSALFPGHIWFRYNGFTY